MGIGRNWTKEDEDYLADNWGQISVPGLCKKLNRSKNAIMVRVQRLGLPPFLESGEYVTFEVDADFRNNFDTLKEFDVSVEIKKYRERRSKDANAICA